MNVYEIRRRNIRMLVQEMCGRTGPINELARRMGWLGPYASAVAGKKAQKNIGDKNARLVECEFGKPLGWLDTPHWPDTHHRFATHNDGALIIKEVFPLVSSDKVAAWIAGEDASHSDTGFPVFPGANLGHRAYVMQEYMRLMLPAEPGDYYYVDPDVPPASGTDCVFIVNGRPVAGIFDQTPLGHRLEFKRAGEPPIQVELGAYAGRIMLVVKVTQPTMIGCATSADVI